MEQDDWSALFVLRWGPLRLVPMRAWPIVEYTVVVTRRLELLQACNLVLNARYSDSDVPVPGGHGPNGGESAGCSERSRGYGPRSPLELCASGVGKLLRTKFVHVGLLLLGFDGNLMPGLL